MNLGMEDGTRIVGACLRAASPAPARPTLAQDAARPQTPHGPGLPALRVREAAPWPKASTSQYLWRNQALDTHQPSSTTCEWVSMAAQVEWKRRAMYEHTRPWSTAGHRHQDKPALHKRDTCEEAQPQRSIKLHDEAYTPTTGQNRWRPWPTTQTGQQGDS